MQPVSVVLAMVAALLLTFLALTAYAAQPSAGRLRAADACGECDDGGGQPPASRRCCSHAALKS